MRQGEELTYGLINHDCEMLWLVETWSVRVRSACVGKCCLVRISKSVSLGPVTSRNLGGLVQSCCRRWSSFVRVHVLRMFRFVCLLCGCSGILKVGVRVVWAGLILSMSSECLGICSALLTCWMMSLGG